LLFYIVLAILPLVLLLKPVRPGLPVAHMPD
jgi:hypothetical protein